MATILRSVFASLCFPLSLTSCFRRVGLALGVAAVLTTAIAAQTPVVLPNTMATVAGNTPTASTANAACPTNAQFTAQDALGNGCPAVNATFTGNEKGIAVDPYGNVYTANSSTNPQSIRRIDARTGNISLFAGFAANGTTCSTAGVTVEGTTYVQTDKVGDNCPVSLSGGLYNIYGVATDPYGNILFADGGDLAVHLVCTNASPLCTAAQVKVNLMRNVAGCTPAPTGYGTAVSGATVGTAGDGTLATQFSGTCTVGVNAPRAVAADKWDNIYFADNGNTRIRVVLGVSSISVNGNAVANPLYPAEQAWVTAYNTANGTTLAAPTQGFVYPIAGGGTVCSAKTDAGGDGCPFYQTTDATSTYVQGIAVLPDGDFLFDDGLGRLRVIYLGGTAVKSALAANGVSNPVVGTSYALIGNGGTNQGTTTGTNLYYNNSLSGTYLGSAVSLQASSTQKLAVDAVGNIYIGDQAQVLFYDIYTGYVRRLGGGNGGANTASCNSRSNGDGCPIAQSLFGAGNAILPIALDGNNNLYIQDIGNKLVRRASGTNLPSLAVNNTLSSTTVVHLPAGGGVTVTAPADPGFSTSATAGTFNTDSSSETSVVTGLTPASLGFRSEPINVTVTGGSAGTLNLFNGAPVTGTALVFDPSATPATSVLGSSVTGAVAVQVDGAGNTYVVNGQKLYRTSPSGAVKTVINFNPRFFAVDPSGNVYSENGTAGEYVKLSYNAVNDSYTTNVFLLPTVPINGTSTQAYIGPMAVDSFGTLYIADQTNKQLYKYNQTTGLAQQLTQTALVNPTQITQDSYGNLLVVDGTSVLRIPPNGFPITTSSPVANPTVTFPTALTSAPTAIAADQGENIYVATGGNIIALSLSGYQYTIPGITGSGVAVDGQGNLYTAQSSVAGITKVARNAESNNFGTNITTPYVGVFMNTGATASTGFAQSDTGGNYAFDAPSSPLAASAPTCSISSTALAGGTICNTSILFTPTAQGSGATPDNVTLLPAANTIGVLALNGTKTGNNITTTTTLTETNAYNAVYSPTGYEVAFFAQVTDSDGSSPSGLLTLTLDGGNPVYYNLTNGTVTVPYSGLSAGAHMLVAAYQSQPGVVGSSSQPVNFTITQASTNVAWSPAATAQQYSAAVGTGVLDATGSTTTTDLSGNTVTVNVPGVFVYTATNSAGTPRNIHSASYLPIGAYTLGVTFYPTDSTDYTGNTAVVPSYTVTKATTTAGLGTTQLLVAADGTGNYTNVQAAVNTIGATGGGSVYIKPGTYTGDITVVQPNVALRGLGGDPTAVILTHAGGAFGGSGVYAYAGEFTSAQNNGAQLPTGSSLFSGDEGSATLVVAKGTNTAVGTSTLIPNGFYGENFTLANTFDTASTTTTTYVSGGSCTANAGTAQTYSYLYNNGLECASQALAIWNTADLSVFNNVYSTSLQDTIYVGSQGSGSNGYVPSRQYWFRGKVSGDVDYIFGDAAVVFDYSTIYSALHGTTTGGTVTVEAQNKMTQTGSSGDYLSGYVMNSNVFTSYEPGMSNLYFGRPYGPYSTWIMLNSYVDQVSPAGYIEFSGDMNLPTSTYAEYNDIPYTDPATGSADLNGVPYLGLGGNSGSGVTGTRETTSQDPGTPEAGNSVKTTLTAAQAALYYPTAFLSGTVSSAVSSTTNWNPTAALAANVNGFTGTATAATVAGGSSVTILMRPRTPGLGAITNGTYTVPTGAYTLTDMVNGTTMILATGSLDASGEAYFTSSTLVAGTHTMTWVYGGDANFSGSTSSGYTLTVVGSTTTTLSSTAPNGIVPYGSAAPVTVSVASAYGTPGGSATLTIDGTSTQTQTLANGQTTFSVMGLAPGQHTFSATYSGSTAFTASNSTTNLTLTIGKAPLTITPACANRLYDQVSVCSITSVTGYINGDTAATVFSAGPVGTTTALPNSPASGSPYPVTATYTLTTNGANTYAVTVASSTFTVTGNRPQSLLFAPLPNLPHGASYQLTARATSGLAMSYSVTGPATVSGSTLTVNGTGAVTVTATTVTDSTGDYVQVSASQSFTAQ